MSCSVCRPSVLRMWPPPKILKVNPLQPDPGPVDAAVRALAAGRLVVLPTETVYGLAAAPECPGAREALFQAKGRPADKPVARFVSGIEAAAAAGARVDETARRLAAAFWPGPLTLVLDSPDGPLGFRVPDHAVARAVLEARGHALAVTSANRSGGPDPRTAEEALEALGPVVAVVLDAGPAREGVPSTVVRIRAGRTSILRAGALSRDAIQEISGRVGP